MPLAIAVQEKIHAESEAVVLLKDKLSMCPVSEELTKLFTI